MLCIAITEDVISARVSDGLSKHRLRGGGRGQSKGSRQDASPCSLTFLLHFRAFSLQVQSCCENLAKKSLSSGTAMSEIRPPPLFRSAPFRCKNPLVSERFLKSQVGQQSQGRGKETDLKEMTLQTKRCQPACCNSRVQFLSTSLPLRDVSNSCI